jgi:disulfide bond formation protein DsbB
MNSLLQFAAQRRRLLNLGGATACAAILAMALYLQHGLGLEPCPLCMFQRVGMAALGVVFLLAWLHHPGRIGAGVYAALIALAALTTAAIAGRHIYVQLAPAGSIPACGAPLDAMLRMFPITKVIDKVLRGSGECSKIDWSLLGLSLPWWVLIAALALGIAGVFVNLARVNAMR